LVSGYVGDHGIAILSQREGYNFGSELVSDVAPLNNMIHDLLSEAGGVVKMKDPTRGGLANALNEWSAKSNVGILIDESKIPMRESVKAASEMLGIDPLEVANEGKIILSVVPQKVEDVLNSLLDSKEGRDAEVIGDVTNDFSRVVIETEVGGKRILSPPVGDPIPRIC